MNLASPAKRIALRCYRLFVVAAIAFILHAQFRGFEARRLQSISLEQAQSFFPNAARVELRDPDRGFHFAFDTAGAPLGALLTTSPETDEIVGYSGPNNLLLALDTNGAIAGVELLRSGDTREHVELVQRDRDFFRTFLGWKPRENAAPPVSGVAGATLTSLAIAEAVQKRLAGATPSLRFPEPVTLDETRTLFTNAASLHADGRRHRVVDASGTLLGYVARTSPEADNVSGYSGPTEALVGIAPDGKTVTGLQIRKSYDTASYAEQIRDEEMFLKSFVGRTIDQLATLDYKREKIEGVSGATQTSFALAESLKRHFAAELTLKSTRPALTFGTHDWALAAIVAGGALMAFTTLRGKRWARLGWQAVLIGYVGLLSGDLLSLQLFGGWATHGLLAKAAPGLVVLAAAALVLPWLTRRQVYCHQICPHGAAQQWLGALGRRFFHRHHAPLRGMWHRVSYGPGLLLALAVLTLVLGLKVNLSQWEPFDAWIFRAATWTTGIIAVVGLGASIFIPQAYCRFGCPTGALLNFVRSSGSAERWEFRDTAGAALLGVVLIAAMYARGAAAPHLPNVATFHGKTMGTTWTVKIRGTITDRQAIQRAISNEFEIVEQLTSHWRSNTPVSRFNQSISTNSQTMPPELVHLAGTCAAISEQSGGAFDITVAPLMSMWGFGPSPHTNIPPSDADLDQLKPAIGWHNLDVGPSTWRKLDPHVQVDLSAMVPGWANDRVAQRLAALGFTNFLVESGGELRARGLWTIAIEHPARSCTLSNDSIGTSGTYRQNHKSGEATYSHLIDPRTLRPVNHSTVSVSVRAKDCATADAWAAALNVLGHAEGMPIADQLGLAAQFVVERQPGRLEVNESKAWLKPATPPAYQRRQ